MKLTKKDNEALSYYRFIASQIPDVAYILYNGKEKSGDRFRLYDKENFKRFEMSGNPLWSVVEVWKNMCLERTEIY